MTDSPREKRKPTLRERAEVLGFEVTEGDPDVVQVIFLGPKGAEAMKKQLERDGEEEPDDTD